VGTAIIDICHLGSNFKARALKVSGSEATFISERQFKFIKLPHHVIRAQVSCWNHTVSAESIKLCQFTTRSPNRPSLQINTTAYVTQLAGNLPSCPISQQLLRNLPELPLADTKFFVSAQIDILVGANVLPSILLSGTFFYPWFASYYLRHHTSCSSWKVRPPSGNQCLQPFREWGQLKWCPPCWPSLTVRSDHPDPEVAIFPIRLQCRYQENVSMGRSEAYPVPMHLIPQQRGAHSWFWI